MGLVGVCWVGQVEEGDGQKGKERSDQQKEGEDALVVSLAGFWGGKERRIPHLEPPHLSLARSFHSFTFSEALSKFSSHALMMGEFFSFFARKIPVPTPAANARTTTFPVKYISFDLVAVVAVL